MAAESRTRENFLRRPVPSAMLLAALLLAVVLLRVFAPSKEEDQLPPLLPRDPKPGDGKPFVEVPAEPIPLESAESPKGQQLIVRVVDATADEPIEQAEVSVILRRGATEESLQLASQARGQYSVATTDDSSAVVLGVRVDAPGYECFRRTGWPQTNALAVWLTQLEDLKVIVTQESGMRVKGIAVELEAPSWSHRRLIWPREAKAPRSFPRVSETITDVQGEAFFTNLLPGSGYEVKVMGKDLLAPAFVRGVEVSVGGPSEVTVVINAGGKVFGTVVDSHGQPGVGYSISCKKEVRASSGSRGFIPEQSTVVGADGFFEFAGLSAGRKLLRFSRTLHGANEFFTLRLSLEEGEAHDCGTVGPEPLSGGGVQVFGLVAYPDGTPAPGCEMRARVGPRGATKDIKLNFSADDEGRFRLLGLPPQELFLSATTDGGDYFVSERWRLEQGETKTITLFLKKHEKQQAPGGDLLITMLTAGEETVDLSEQSDLTPYVIDADGLLLEVATGARRTDSGDLSNILVGRPSPGRYRLLVAGEGLASPVYHCTVRDKEVEVVQARLHPAAEVTGRVLNEGGDPVSAVVGRTFADTLPAGGPHLVHPVRVDDLGRFRLRSFIKGESGTVAVITGDDQAILIPCVAPANLGEISLIGK